MERRRQLCVLLFLQVIIFVENSFAENLILNVNFEKPIAVTNDAFLSFTLDPETLLRNADNLTKTIERSRNMARSMAPAYVRFEQTTDLSDVAADSHNVLSEMHWPLIRQWTENAGLNVIACIAPRFIESESRTHLRDPTNYVAEFLSFGHQMGYNISWQLGYECQTRCELSGEDLGRHVRNLRNLLEIYPEYSNSLIIGPDIVAYKTTQQQCYLHDYFNSAIDALSAITWHPNFAGISVSNDNVSVHYDNLAAEMDEMYNIIGRIAGYKPLWIAESRPEKYKHQYLGALMWTRRLGNAAKLGIQVVMRQPQELNEATPDYWVSLLHKNLVGREVFEMRIQYSDKENVHFYSQCTKPSALYGKGAVTIFGVNLSAETVIANLKGLNIKTLHKYILSPNCETGNKMFSKKILLNDKPLNLIDDEKVPDLQPDIIIDSDNIELELFSGDIGFWVIPDAKVKACMHAEEKTIVTSVTKKLSKRHETTIQHDNQDKRENQSINQSNLRNRKTKQDKRMSKKRKHVETKNQENNFWNSKILERLTRFFQKRLLPKEKNDSSKLQRSIKVILKEEQRDPSEKEKDLPNLSNDIHNTLKKYKRSLLEERDQIESEHARDLKTENHDNALTSYFDADKEVTSNESTTVNEIKTTNEAKVNVEINGKVKENLNTLENLSKQTSVIEKLQKFFNILLNTLQDNEPTKIDEDTRFSVQKSSTEENRFKRDLDGILKNSQNAKLLDRRSRVDDLDKDIERTVKRKILRKRKLTSDNPRKNRRKINRRSLLRRKPVKRIFFENEISPAQIDDRSTQQKTVKRESKRRKKTSVNRKYLRPDDEEHYQSAAQTLERAKREMAKKLTDISLRKENMFRKRSRIDDYLGETKIKRKDDLKREGFLIPFNPRISENDENNFYGFFRRQPINNFPEGDVFVTTGDSVEENGENYDYVDDENDRVDLKQKTTRNEQTSTLDCTESDTWKDTRQVEDLNHHDYVAKEFFENVKLSDAKLKEASKDYGDLWEAQYLLAEYENKNADVKRKDGVDEKRQVSSNFEVQHERPDEMEGKRIRERSVGYDRDEIPGVKYELTEPQRCSTTFHRFTEIPAYTNQYTSNVRPEEAKLKRNPESKVSFRRAIRGFTANYNNANYGAQYRAKISEGKNSFAGTSADKAIDTEPIDLYRPAEYSILDGVVQTGRTKRNDWEKLKADLAREMIKEDENNAKDCHCRVIRASDSSSEIDDVDTYFARNARNLITKGDYERIMTGEILPSTSTESNKRDVVADNFIAVQSNEVYHGSNSETTTDATAISPMDSSLINISEQPDNAEISELSSADSALGMISPNNDNTVEDIAKQTFFRGQSSDVSAETTTYDRSQTDYNIYSDNRKDLVSPSIPKTSQKTTREKKEAIVDEEEEIESSTDSTITANQADEERYENTCTSVKPTISLEGIAEGTTTETSPSKRATDTLSIDNSQLNETTQKMTRNIKDNPKNKSEARRNKSNLRMQEMMQKLEENLIKHAERIAKRKERLSNRREKLFEQHHQESSQIVEDREKRNLRRRETWEKFCENDDFRQLIDQREFIGIMIDDEEEEHDGRYNVIPIELAPKQYDALLNQIYPFVKEARNLEHNRSQLLRQLKLLEDERESAESISRSDERVFAIDPSTYYGGEPTLQLYKDHLKPAKYRSSSQIKSQIWIPKRMLKDFHQSYSRKSDGDRYPSGFRLEKYIKQLPSNYDNQEKADVSNVLSAQNQSDLSKDTETTTRDDNIKTNVADEESVSFNDEKTDRSNFRFENARLVRDMKTENETNRLIDVHDKKEDVPNIKTIKDLKNIEKITETKTFDTRREILNAKCRKAAVKTRRLNRRNKNAVEKDKNSDKSDHSDEMKENLNITTSNDSETIKYVESVTDVDSEQSELEQELHEREVTRTRRSVEKPTSNKYLELPPYFLLTRSNGRNGANRDIHIYLNKNSEETSNKRPRTIQHIFLRRISDSIDDDNFSNDFPIPVELFRFVIKTIADLIDEYSSSESFEELDNYDTLLFLSNLLNKTAMSNENIYSESEQQNSSSVDDEDVQSNNQFRKEDTSEGEQCGSKRSEESDNYSEIEDTMEYYNPIELRKHGIFVLLPQRNQKRQRRQIDSEINEKIDEIKHERKGYKFMSIQDSADESAYYLNDNNVNEGESAETIKMKSTRTNYSRPVMDKRYDDNLLKDFIEARKKNNFYNNEISHFMKNKNKDNAENNILKSDENLSVFLEKPISVLENLIITSEETEDLTESVEQFSDNLEDKRKETFALDEDRYLKNKTCEINGNDLNDGYIQKLFAFVSEIPRIFMYKF